MAAASERSRGRVCARFDWLEELVEKIEAGEPELEPVDVPDDHGWYRLHDAAKFDHCKGLEILLKHEKTNVNWCTPEICPRRQRRRGGRTALYFAARNGCVDCVRILLKYGADVMLSPKGESLLTTATESGCSDCVEALINAGAPVDVPDGWGWYPIHYATRCKSSSDCLELLLTHEKTDINWRTRCGNTALSLAAENGFIDHVRILLQYGADVMRSSPIIAATESGNADCVQALINAGAPVALPDGYRRYPIDIAASRNYCECLEVLLQHDKANSNVKPCQRRLPLNLAAGKGCVKCVRLLLNSGADVTSYNESLVFNAIRSGNADCVQVLIDAGAPVDIPDACGRYPIHEAASIGNDECLTVLLQNGADVNLCTNDGEHLVGLLAKSFIVDEQSLVRCLHLVMPYVDKSVVLQSTSDPVFITIRRSCKKLLNLLLDDVYSVNRSTSNTLYSRDSFPLIMKPMATPLGCAVYMWDLETVQKLLNLGADMQPDDMAVCSPFLLATTKGVQENRPEILNEFLKRGVNLNFIDPNSLVHIPDAFVVAACGQNEKILLDMLKAGLKPRLEHWCGTKIEKCSTMNWDQEYSSFLRHISSRLTREKLEGLIRLLLPFSGRGLPSCCDAWIIAFGDHLPDDFGNWQDQPLPLMHLCRIKIREQVTSDQLFTGDWIKKIPLPGNLKKYLTYSEIAS